MVLEILLWTSIELRIVTQKQNLLDYLCAGPWILEEKDNKWENKTS